MYWVDKVVSLSTATEEEEHPEDANIAMRNRLHKSQVRRYVWPRLWQQIAMDDEHGQVMSAYFKANQLIAGCHLPQLYIKLEYSLTNNTHLAEKFFSQALEVAPMSLA